MSLAPRKALVQMTDRELKQALETVAQNVQYSYNDIIGELNRRRSNRITSIALIVAIVNSILSLVLAILRQV